MSEQTRLTDEEIFDEAADELREELRLQLAAVEAALPAQDDVWETDATNVLGVLNGLRSQLETADATERLHSAKKTFALAERSDAFEDVDAFGARLERIEATMTAVTEAAELVGALTTRLPALRDQLPETD